MRVLIVQPGPAFSVADVATGYTKAFMRAGWDVQTFDTEAVMAYHGRALKGVDGLEDPDGQTVARMMNQSLRGALYDWLPDLVVIVSSFFIAPETYKIMRQRPGRVAVIFTESPYEDDGQVPIAAYADVCVLNDPQNLDRFRSVNPYTLFLPHAYDPEVHHYQQVPAFYESDFCFVGTGYPSRIKWFETVHDAHGFDGLDVALAGNWQDLPDDSPLSKYLVRDKASCNPNTETVKFYSGARSSVNVYRTEAMRAELEHGWAMGPREVELAAVGTFFLTQERGENREVLPMVPTFDTAEDFADKLQWWLAHDSERERVVTAARAAVADRTFDANLSRLLRVAGF